MDPITAAEVIVKAAHREGYEAEVRDGHAYFPGAVWYIDIGSLIQRERLTVGWNDGIAVVSSGPRGFEARGATLKEAVLRFIGDRP